MCLEQKLLVEVFWTWEMKHNFSSRSVVVKTQSSISVDQQRTPVAVNTHLWLHGCFKGQISTVNVFSPFSCSFKEILPYLNTTDTRIVFMV